MSINPMHPKPSPVLRLQLACRCGAKTRKGAPCRSPAVKGRRRCRMHGGTSPGAPKGKRNGRYRSGIYTQELREARAQVRALVKLAKATLG